MDTDSFSHFPFHFYPPPSSLITIQNPKRKRSKMIKINDNLISPSTSSSSKPKKPDPSAPKITRPCTECGKKFWSWKALFGHMRCHPERQWRGINPPPNFRRSRVSETMTDQDIEIATCLILLANGRSDADVAKPKCREVEELETAAAAVEVCRDVECSGSSSSWRFECSSCKKVFGSHQALGGHRASHKNVKGCFAMAALAENVGMAAAAVVHECSVCLKVFSSGQALGGHMRCHWEEKEECFNGFLDLNLPPMDHMQHSSSSFSSRLILDLRLRL